MGSDKKIILHPNKLFKKISITDCNEKKFSPNNTRNPFLYKNNYHNSKTRIKLKTSIDLNFSISNKNYKIGLKKKERKNNNRVNTEINNIDLKKKKLKYNFKNIATKKSRNFFNEQRNNCLSLILTDKNSKTITVSKYNNK